MVNPAAVTAVKVAVRSTAPERADQGLLALMGAIRDRGFEPEVVRYEAAVCWFAPALVLDDTDVVIIWDPPSALGQPMTPNATALSGDAGDLVDSIVDRVAKVAGRSCSIAGRVPQGDRQQTGPVLRVQSHGAVVNPAVIRSLGGVRRGLGPAAMMTDIGWRSAKAGWQVAGDLFGPGLSGQLTDEEVIRVVSLCADADLRAPLLVGPILANSCDAVCGDLDVHLLDLQRRPGGDDESHVVVPGSFLGAIHSLDQVQDTLCQEQELAAFIATRQKLPLRYERRLVANTDLGDRQDIWTALWSLPALLNQRPRILMVTDSSHASFDANYHRGLIKSAQTHGEVIYLDVRGLAEWERASSVHKACPDPDVMILSGAAVGGVQPSICGNSTVFLDLPPVRQVDNWPALATFAARMDRGFCRTDDDRDVYLGFLAGIMRINVFTYDRDPDLEALLSVVFCVPSRLDRSPLASASADTDIGWTAMTKALTWPVRAADARRTLNPSNNNSKTSFLTLVKHHYSRGGMLGVLEKAAKKAGRASGNALKQAQKR